MSIASKIRLLDDETINQIAAGEVIENPASVVKELVENAIDAGARQVIIEILAGGLQQIQVIDDGDGMSSEDALLSLERHATSKIAKAEDLFTLTTMGFRGEALASIAAISKLSIKTALEGATGTLVEVEGGKVSHVGSAARTRGTTITVSSLFYNVPARKKFQKSIAASGAEVTRVVTGLALAHPETGITLMQQGRTLFSLPPAEPVESFLDLLKKRASILLSADFLPAAYPLVWEGKAGNMEGLIGDPRLSRHNRSGQFLFVNRRPVVCPAISFAIRDAYATRLPEGRHPVYLLHLSIPSSLVDVNVHPQKKEIRLREESLFRMALREAVLKAFHPQEKVDRMESVIPEFTFSAPISFPEVPLVFREEESLPETSFLSLPTILHPIGLYGNYFFVDAESLPISFPAGILCFDLSAAERRLRFDQLMKGAETRPLSQGLLMPLTLTFSRYEVELLSSHLDALERLGIEMRSVGATAFLIEAIPPFLTETEVQKVLEEFISRMQSEFKGDLLKHLAISLSRRGDVRKNPYTVEEGRRLIEELLRSPEFNFCPDGKATLFHLSEEEIENRFSGKKS